MKTAVFRVVMQASGPPSNIAALDHVDVAGKPQAFSELEIRERVGMFSTCFLIG